MAGLQPEYCRGRVSRIRVTKLSCRYRGHAPYRSRLTATVDNTCPQTPKEIIGRFLPTAAVPEPGGRRMSESKGPGLLCRGFSAISAIATFLTSPFSTTTLIISSTRRSSHGRVLSHTSRGHVPGGPSRSLVRGRCSRGAWQVVRVLQGHI